MNLKPRARLSAIERRQRREKWEALAQDVGSAQEYYLNTAKTIARTHNRSLKWSTKQLYLGSHKMMKHRASNPWNGFIREKLRKANKDCPIGMKWRLPAFVREYKKELEEEYKQLTVTVREEFRNKIMEIRTTNKKLPRANPKGIQKDMDNTFDVFKKEFCAVEHRTGCKAFYVAVRGDVEHFGDPKVYMGPETERFFKEVLNINPGKLAMQYEAYIVGGTAALVSSSKKVINDEISECRTFIADALEEILKKHNVPTNVKSAKKLMNYDNYERKVVENYRVELRGWPCAEFVNPSRLRRPEIQLLLAKLKAGRCSWVKLSEDELRARITSNHARHEAGEAVYKPRKTAKGKGGLQKENVACENDLTMAC